MHDVDLHINDDAFVQDARATGIQVETGRDVQVRFSHGSLAERGMIRGHPARAQLTRLIDVDGRTNGGVKFTGWDSVPVSRTHDERARSPVLAQL